MVDEEPGAGPDLTSVPEACLYIVGGGVDTEVLDTAAVNSATQRNRALGWFISNDSTAKSNGIT